MKHIVDMPLNAFRAGSCASGPGTRHGVFPVGGKRLERLRGDAEKTPLAHGGSCAPFSRLATVALAVLVAVTLSWPLAGCGSFSEHMADPSADGTGRLADPDGGISAAEEDAAYEGDAAPMGEASPLASPGGIEGGCADPFNTEEYGQVDEPGFAAVATSPLSTLSSDVDTASYCNLRRMLQDGYAADDIPTGAVRIEEMLNYFDYDYALPEGDDLFGTTVALGDCPWNGQTKLLVLGFATAPETSVEDVGRNLVFLIDSSGSMDDPRKLPLLKEAFEPLVRNLNENDRISIVTYAGEEEVIADGISGDRKGAIMRAIRRVRADGCTNGQAGLAMAYELAQDNYIEGGVNRIVMASDGDLNVGMTSESDLHDYVSDMRDTGIYLSVLGFGDGNYKDTKMETLADNGNGQYHYIDCAEEAVRTFDDQLTANTVPLADDVKLQVEFNPDQVKGYRLIGYENRAMTEGEFEDEAADAGDVGPGHQFTVAYEVVPADSRMDVPAANLKYRADDTAAGADGSGAGKVAEGGGALADEWATITMRYKPVTGGNAEQHVAIRSQDLSDDPGADWEFATSVIEFGMLLRSSDYAGDASYDRALELAQPSAGDDTRAEFCSLVDLARGGGRSGGDDGWLFDERAE
jgi:Ca-activated chloride channel family protein